MESSDRRTVVYHSPAAKRTVVYHQENEPSTSRDLSQEDSYTRKHDRWRDEKCPLCDMKSKHLAPHVQFQHLPWWFDPQNVCWVCRQAEKGKSRLQNLHKHEDYDPLAALGSTQRNNWVEWSVELLNLVAEDMGLQRIDELLEFCGKVRYERTLKGSQLQVLQKQLYLGLNIRPGGQLPKDGICIRPPNCLAALMDWRVLVNLLRQVSENVRERIHLLHFEPPSEQNVVEKTSSSEEDDQIQTLFDSHAHIDILLSRNRCQTFRQFEMQDTAHQVGSLKIKGANFVFPAHWKHHSSIIKDHRIHATFGIHPNMISSPFNKQLQQLEKLLSHPSCVGLGEVGLDFYHNTSRESHRTQHHFLRQVLDIFIPLKHVLVLHCRDQGDGAASAQVLQLLTEKIPTDSRIHFDCFLGKLCQVTEWRKAFPKCYFGITNLIRNNKEAKEAAAKVPLNKFVLESDCPYIGCSPVDVLPAAETMASVKHMTLDAILAHENNNVVELYGLCE